MSCNFCRLFKQPHIIFFLTPLLEIPNLQDNFNSFSINVNTFIFNFKLKLSGSRISKGQIHSNFMSCYTQKRKSSFILEVSFLFLHAVLRLHVQIPVLPLSRPLLLQHLWPLLLLLRLLLPLL